MKTIVFSQKLRKLFKNNKNIIKNCVFVAPASTNLVKVMFLLAGARKTQFFLMFLLVLNNFLNFGGKKQFVHIVFNGFFIVAPNPGHGEGGGGKRP